MDMKCQPCTVSVSVPQVGLWVGHIQSAAGLPNVTKPISNNVVVPFNSRCLSFLLGDRLDLDIGIAAIDCKCFCLLSAYSVHNERRSSDEREDLRIQH